MRESPEAGADKANHARDQKDDNFEPSNDAEHEDEVMGRNSDPKISAAMQKLKITSRDMTEYFRSKGIPHCLDNPPAESHKKLYSS